MGIHIFFFNKMNLKMSAKWLEFCLVLNVLTHYGLVIHSSFIHMWRHMAWDILVNIGSGNGLSTVRHQASTWITANLTHWPLGDFKLISVNGGWSISYEIALSWMPLDLTDDKSTLVQVMAWCRQATRHYPVFEIALSTLVDIRSTNELTFGGPVLILVDRRNMQ